ncbi:MAG TPA: hypothetical protein ENF35_02445 [Aciduliprofundum sp.]|nr:hypothetical protein [Aciduliprofundum sp.]
MPRFLIKSPLGERVVEKESPTSGLEVLRELDLPYPYYVMMVSGRPVPLDTVLEGDEEALLLEATSRG